MQVPKIIQYAIDGYISGVDNELRLGIPIDVKSEYGETALIASAIYGHDDIFEFLLSRKADIRAVDYWGGTSLIYAALSGNRKTVQLALSAGVDTGAVDNDAKKTAAEWAEFYGHYTIATIIREYEKKGDTKWR